MTAKQPPKPKTGTRPQLEKTTVEVTLDREARMLTVWFGRERCRHNSVMVGDVSWIMRNEKGEILGFETLCFDDGYDLELKAAVCGRPLPARLKAPAKRQA